VLRSRHEARRGTGRVNPPRHDDVLLLEDPDGNNIETFVECLPDAQAAMDYMVSPAFVGNPVGQPLDGDALLARMRAGAGDEELMYFDRTSRSTSWGWPSRPCGHSAEETGNPDGPH